MIILYNPKSGAPIKKFIFEGSLIEPHEVNQLKQYEPRLAEALKETYSFLEEVSLSQAQEILNKPKTDSLKCQYCDFTTDIKIALMGHNRKHAGEIAKTQEPQIDPALVPIATGTKVINAHQLKEIDKALEKGEDLPNGTDEAGVTWYGAGLTEENKSQTRVQPFGQRGHFGAA